ncbi:hypothetical protein LMG23992_01395 [Cupriavidus laharis]|uniref:Tripartite tricarboxylate transporter substrate binding protein n=1 Tax=Cupriavidus laharis TaxID=151654 RepID=A0ABM8WNX3_9BURK|nr:hypothetical protein LMG23992_01395 [Cupriavidus laharis]
MVVPYPPGGATDNIARLVSKRLAEKLGQPVIVQNKPGAATNIASAQVAKAAPDGHTLLLVTLAFASNRWLFSKPGYKVEEFAPVAQLVRIPVVLSVGAGSDMRTFDDFAKRARGGPGSVNVGNPGAGAAPTLACDLLRVKHDLPFATIPYQGSAQLLTDILGGHVPVACDTVSAQLPFLRQGKLVPLVVLGSTRSALLPNVPTAEELGIKDVAADGWMGVVAPAGIAGSTLQLLNRYLREIAEEPAVREQITSLGLEPKTGSVAEFGAWIAQETDRWMSLVMQLGLTPQ